MTPSLDELLLRWEEARERGEPASLQELCESCPEQTAELVQLTRRLEALDRLFRPDAPEPTDNVPTTPLRRGPHGVPLRLAGYDVRGELGRGGMAVVYEGFDPTLGRRVALKVLMPALGLTPGPDDGVARRFHREARVLAQLKHDNVVPVYGADLHAGAPFFVMELVEGGTLRDHLPRLARGPVEPRVALVLGIARGVAHAHAKGVLHRDLKPANVLLDADGRPRVADFGLARLLDPAAADGGRPAPAGAPREGAIGETQLTLPGGEPGTPAYMAPEQFRPDRGAVGKPTDVWALGVIFYELLTGRRPFAGQTREQLAEAVCRGAPPPPRSLRPGLSADLEAVCLKCLAGRPEDRYADMPALIADLERCGRGEVPAARAMGTLARAGRAAWRWRVGLMTAGAAALAALVLAVPDWEEWRRRGATAPARRALQAGQVADLGPRQGQIGHRALTGAVTAEALEGGAVRFTTKALDPALIELLPDPGVDDFEVEAELRHDAAQHPFSGVGLFVAHTRHKAAGQPQHFCVLASFCDLGLNARAYTDDRGRPASRAQLSHVHFAGRGHMPLLPASLNGGGVAYAPQEQGAPGPWRALRLRVRQGDWSLVWMGQSCDAAKRADQADWLAALPTSRPEIRGLGITFPARGGIGIYLYGGSVALQSFRVRPLAAPGG